MAIDRDKVARNALRYIQKGQFHKAIGEYEKVLKLDPRDIRVRLKLADLYGRVGRKREAVDVCVAVAETYAEQGFYVKAIAVYKQALRNDPESPSLWRNLGEMYAKHQLVGDALGAFKHAVDLLRGQGLNADAEDLLARMESLAPDNVAIKVHLAELYLEDGRYDEFDEVLGKIVLQLRGEGRSRKLLKAISTFYEKSNHHPSVRNRLAELYVDLGEEDRALEVIAEGLAEDPDDRDLRLLALRSHLVLGQLEDARRIALGLYEEDPEDLFLLEQLAAIAQARGDDRELAAAYRSMAKAYGRKGLSDKEELYYRKVLEVEPGDAEARLALGDVVVDTVPEPVGGEDWGDGAAEWDGDAAGPTSRDEIEEGLLEAELYLKYGIEEKAEAKLRELTELAPDDVLIRQKLRDLYKRSGNRQGWVREQLHIADIFVRGHRENEALRAYQSILEVDPGNAEAVKAIQYLKPDLVHAPPASDAIEIPIDGSMVAFVDGEGGERAVRVPPGDEPPDALRDGLAEAEFYEARGMTDEAVQTLLELRGKYPDSSHVTARLERLGWKKEEDGGFVDLQAEVLDTAGLSLAQGFEGFQDFEVSELDDIVSEFKSGIAERLEEGDFETHYNLGVAYREMGLMDDAIQEFRVAAQSPEKARDAYASMAQVYREQSRWDDARTALRQALAVPVNTDEDRAAILYELGDLAEEAGDWDEAFQNFEKAAALDPGVRDVGARLRKLQTNRARG